MDIRPGITHACHDAGVLQPENPCTVMTPWDVAAQELRCCGSTITRLALSADDAMLFVAAADGSAFVMDVKDRDPARAALG